MPRYRVIERRAFTSGYLIEAENEEAAKQMDGDIIDSGETDSWGDELISCEEVAAEKEELGDI